MPLVGEHDVLHAAELARLHLSDAERAEYVAQLSRILEYVSRLSELDTADVPPTAHPLPIGDVLRRDEVQPSVGTDAALRNAPDARDGFFVVPKVLEHDGA